VADANPTPELATAEERYEFLVGQGVLVENEDRVAVSEAYDAERGVYHDTYADASDEQFHQTLADLFGLSVDEARDQAEELGVTRAELVAYLTLRAYLEDRDADPDVGTLLQLAGMVADLDPESPVPASMPELTDDDYEAFLEAHPDAVLFVWRRHCAPCEELKADLDELRAAAPDRAAFAGVDGESVVAFRREFEVDAAPATLTFAGGALVETVEGRRSPEQYAELFAETFD
jgi:thiol-disulfide isomerase/thioredoxin